jgi:hypothetical protein
MEQQISWTGIITVTLAAVSLSTGAAMAYLTLFINQKVSAMKDQIISHIDDKFAVKETMLRIETTLTDDIKEIKDRLNKIEQRS